MNILLLAPHPFFQLRGTPIAERQLLLALTGLGHEVTVLTVASGEDLSIPGVRILRLPKLPGTARMRPGFSLAKLACDAAMLVACWRELGRRHYDVVHAVEDSAFVALVVGRLRRCPYVYDMDSSMPQQLVDEHPWLRPVAPLLRRFEAAAVRGSVGVLAVCSSLEQRAREHLPHLLSATIEDVSLLDVDSTSEATALATEELAAIPRPRVLYIGNFAPYQGIDLLLAGFSRLVHQGSDASLVLIGGAENDLRRYRSLAEGLGLAGRAHFLGERPIARLRGYLDAADVVVSPRISGDNTPMKLYSYLAAGRAVLATRLPTHTQVLDDEVARLVPPRAEELAAALSSLLADDKERRRLGARAAELARREFTPEAQARKVAAFYHQVAARLRVAGAQEPVTAGGEG